MTRYAVYFAPEAASPLWRYGSRVIGVDAATGADVPFLTTADLEPAAWSALTDDPRRYGFHGTLKAPFSLADGVDEAQLIDAATALAASHATFQLEGLSVAEIGRFIALVPVAPEPLLKALAADAVQSLDDLRAPLSEADRARRLTSPLTARQTAYLDRFGYPYVLDEFRFHMTLTGPIGDAALRARVRDRLAGTYATSVPSGPVIIDAIALYRQDRRDGRFRIIARLALSGRRDGAVPR